MNGNDSLAYFGQIDWASSDTMSLTLGLRHTEDEKQATESLRVVRWDPTLSAVAPAVDITRLITANNDVSRELWGEWSATTGTFGLEWSPTDEMLSYLKYTRGYKSGGFNSGTIADDPTVGEEFIDAYELGLKSTIADSFRLNLAAFYYDYQDFQDSVSRLPTDGGPLEVACLRRNQWESRSKHPGPCRTASKCCSTIPG